jgi:hypothetical protein
MAREKCGVNHRLHCTADFIDNTSLSLIQQIKSTKDIFSTAFYQTCDSLSKHFSIIGTPFNNNNDNIDVESNKSVEKTESNDISNTIGTQPSPLPAAATTTVVADTTNNIQILDEKQEEANEEDFDELFLCSDHIFVPSISLSVHKIGKKSQKINIGTCDEVLVNNCNISVIATQKRTSSSSNRYVIYLHICHMYCLLITYYALNVYLSICLSVYLSSLLQ